MNNDGFGFLGAGMSDNRLAGRDLQHNRQTRTTDEAPQVHRMVTQVAEAGGPMKDYLDHENQRHLQALEHQKNHLEKHYSRGYDTQHGHDQYKY